ncbi:MAG: ribosome-associated translation inhibitor RaiA [Deltaproteobacteria bacterium]|nr:ribosome-associated translation inhibitor RaiA [Deltaproteobacteria bacterium]
MRIAFTFRNLDSSEDIKNYASEKIAKLQKYLRAPLDAEITLTLERHLHCIDINLTADGEVYMGREESEDMYASIDVAVDKIRKQVTRTKSAYAQRRRSSIV